MKYHIAIVLLIFTVVAGSVSLNNRSHVFAQDAMFTTFTVRIENISDTGRIESSGVMNMPVGATEAGPATPGNTFEINFTASEGAYLTFATMFGQSNDLFFAPAESGIALYDMDGSPFNGDVTNQITLWDAGTEVNEEPLVGANQGPRQEAPNTGEAENGVVQPVNDGFTYPAISELMIATLTASDDGAFTLRIENISGDTATPTPFAPVLWVVHHDSGVLFTNGQSDRGEGLEHLAEDGNPSILSERVAKVFATPFSPGVAIVHTDAGVLFTLGEADRGVGLEAQAEDANPEMLAMLDYMGVKHVGVFNTPEDADGPGPILPGGALEFTVEGVAGDYLTFASMFGQSNDLFIGPNTNGIALFDAEGNAIHGEIFVELWDAGTEVNEEPGVGENQAPRQSGPNTGVDENGVVQIVNDGFVYPITYNLVRITIYSGADMMGDDMSEDDSMGDNMDEMSEDSMSDDDNMEGAS